MAISKKDQAELRRIIRTSFELLEQGLKQREREVKKTIREQIAKEHNATLKEVRQELKNFVTEAKDLERKAARAVEAANKRGIGFSYYRTDNIIDVSDNLEQLEVKDIDKRVQEAYEQIAIDHGYTSFDLKREQLQLERDLAVGSIEDGDAKSFLDRIPDVNKLLPTPKEVKQLVVAS